MVTDFPIGWICALGVAWLIGYVMGQRRGEPTWRNSAVKRMELQQQIDDLSKEGRTTIDKALSTGHTIEAIRAFRSETNTNLKNAKEAIDLIKANRSQSR
ncbi:MAG: hypothetical protein ACRBCJ_02685 [Hyphomicrobiaceae bacterium]